MHKLLSIFLIGACVMTASAAPTGVKGTVLDARSGAPVGDANILLDGQGIMVTTDAQGQFQITNAQSGTDQLQIIAYGYDDADMEVEILRDLVRDLGEIRLKPEYDGVASPDESMTFDEDEINDDESGHQQIGTISGSTDDLFYRVASYNFNNGIWYRQRGLDNRWQEGYVNGVNFNDLMRGVFNFSGLGGMTSSAFRNKSTEVGLASASYGFGSVNGSQQFTTYASEYAPGFHGNVSYTNSNYYLRAMLQYSTGLNKYGWAFSASVIGRYSDRGVIPGTWYNSFGYAVSIQKVFNDKHSLNLSTWGAPTLRASNRAATQEAYDLAGSNLYNPEWGNLNGKRISANVRKSFDPAVMLNWLFKPSRNTFLNTAFAFRQNNYARSRIDFYQAPDPKADYYRNLPSYYIPTAVYDPEDPFSEESLRYEAEKAQYDMIYNRWVNDESARQINWDQIYQTNLLNGDPYIDADGNVVNREKEIRASYILKYENTNQQIWMLNSNINHRFTDELTLQGGVSLNYTNAHYFSTVKDLLGADYWLDIDNFSERDFSGDPNKLQNDLLHPNRKVKEGDIFGWDYNIHAIRARAWLQNEWNFTHWNVNYAAEISNTNFWRDGKMMNGRFPENSYGKGGTHNFVTGAGKAGVTYKPNGRNFITAYIGGGSRAPQISNAYVNARTQDATVSHLEPEEYVAASLTYNWNYARFRGSVTGFWTEIWNGTQQNYFYDYDLSTFMAYTLSNIQTEYKGVEVALQYKILPSLSVTAAGAFTRYNYKNNPTSVRSAQNGAKADVERITYLKNYYISGTPQQAYSLGVNYNAPKNWFFDLNANFFCDSYVAIAPTRHESEYINGLWKYCTTEQEFLDKVSQYTAQDKLRNAFIMNFSVGKVLYTKWGSLNFNLSLNNLLNNRKIQTNGYQESKLDYTDYNLQKFPNRIYYAQGIRIFFNFGIRF